MNKKAPFHALKKLNIKKRMEVIKDPVMGSSILNFLTPTDFAMLFPKAYRQGLPDVAGFRLAISRKSQQDQQNILEQFTQDIGGLKSSNKSLQEFREKYLGGSGRGSSKRMPQLSEQASKAFDAVQKGPIEVDSELGRTFANVTKDKLASVGVERYSENGKSYYRYVQPEASRQEAISRISSMTGGGSGNTIRERMAFYRQYAMSKGLDPDKVTGIIMREGGQKEAQGQPWSNIDHRRSGGVAGRSYGDFQMLVATDGGAGGMGNDFLASHPGASMEKSNWKQLGMYAIDRMAKSDSPWEAVKDADPLKQRDANRGRIAITEYGKNWWNKNQIAVTDGKSLKPGPDGKYTEEQEKQIASIQEQIKVEKNSYRRQQLANILADAGVTATVDKGPAGATASATDKWSSITPIGGSNYCGRGVANLAEKIFGREHFDNPGHLGNTYASDLSYGAKDNNKFTRSGFYKSGQSVSKDALTPEFLNNLPPGTIVSAGGGRSDGAGHIQMKVGNRWAADHWQNNFSFGRRDGRLYKDFTIFYPSDKGLKTMQEKGLVTNVNITQVVEAPPSTAFKVTSQEEVADDKSLTQVDPNEAQVVSKAAEAAKTVGTNTNASTTAQPAAAPPEIPKAEPSPARYKFDEGAFESAVRGKYGIMASMYDRAGLVEEFKKNLPPGVKYEKGVLTVKDPNNPAIKEAVSGLEKEFGKETVKNVITQIKEEKKPEPKPEPKPEVKAAPKPETKEPPKPEAKEPPKPETKEPPKPAEQPKSDATVKSEPVEQKKVPGAATGGSFFAPDGIMPFNLSKGDDTLAVNPRTGDSMFSFASNENVSFNPNTNKVDISPSNRPYDAPGPQMNTGHDYSNDIKELGDRLDQMMSVLNDKGDKQLSKPEMKQERYDSPNMIENILQANKTPYQSPSFLRAMVRASGKSDYGDDVKDHFSHGNAH